MPEKGVKEGLSFLQLLYKGSCSPEWLVRWRSRCCFCLKALSHRWQPNGFTSAHKLCNFSNSQKLEWEYILLQTTGAVLNITGSTRHLNSYVTHAPNTHQCPQLPLVCLQSQTVKALMNELVQVHVETNDVKTEKIDHKHYFHRKLTYSVSLKIFTSKLLLWY